MVEHLAAGRILKRKSILDLNALEEQHGLILPPVYRSFISRFYDLSGQVFQGADGEHDTLSYFEYDARLLGGKDLFFQGFMRVEEVFKYHKNSDLWVEEGVFPITHHDHGGTIVVGIAGDKADKLYFEHGNGLEFIEEHVYSFLRHLKPVMAFEGDQSRLYQNWSEGFWRLRE